MADKPIRVLFLGDICGKPGREVLKNNLARLKKENKIDICIGNIENIAHGRGAAKKPFDEISAIGVDALTSGNHVFRYEKAY